MFCISITVIYILFKFILKTNAWIVSYDNIYIYIYIYIFVYVCI